VPVGLHVDCIPRTPREMEDLAAAIVPSALVYLSWRMEKTGAEHAARVHAALMDALGRTTSANREYCRDVCATLCHAASLMHPTAAPAVIPSPIAGVVAFAPADTAGAHAGLNLANQHGLSNDARQYCVHTCRRVAAMARLGPGPCDVLPPPEPAEAERLIKVLVAYAAECQFKKTGDRHLHLQTRLTVSAWRTAPIGPHDSPFPPAALAHSDTANDTLRAIIDEPPVDIITAMLKEHRSPTHSPGEHPSALRWCIMSCVLMEELCGIDPIVAVNGDIALMPADGPIVTVVTMMGHGHYDNTIGLSERGHPHRGGGGVATVLLTFLKAAVAAGKDFAPGVEHLAALCQMGHESGAAPNPLSKYLA